MPYEITEIVGVKENAYQGKDSIRFKVKGVEHTLSTLTNDKDKYYAGNTIDGTITSKEKEGKTYYNFNEKKGNSSPQRSTAPAGDINRVEMIARDILNGQKTIGGEITGIKGVLSDILRKIDPSVKAEDEFDVPF